MEMTFNSTKMIHWFCETSDAKELINGRDASQGWRDGAFDALMQMFAQEFPHWTKAEVEIWFVEEVTEYFTSKKTTQVVNIHGANYGAIQM